MDLSADRDKIYAGQMARDAGFSQSGQAVLEYILVLFVVVSIALGIIYQFNDSFKSKLNTYFGDYLACLIETGELPSLGSDSGVSQGECDAGFDSFDPRSGRPLIASSGQGDGGSPGASSSSRGGRPSRYTNSGSSRNGESGRNNFIRNRPQRQLLNKNSGANGKRDESRSSPSADSNTIIRRRRRGPREANIISSDFIDKKAKNLRKKVRKFKKPAKEKELDLLRSARVPLKVDDLDKRQPAQIKEEGSFGLGGFIKLMVILAIFIAILVFVVGQGMQIKKSWQKAD